MKIFPILQRLRKLALSLILLPGLAEAADQELSYYDFTGPTLSGQAAYGAAMASSGDWLAVGAPGSGYDLKSSYVGGRVFLWKRKAGTWKFRQVLVWPYGGPTIERRFGHALAMDGGRLLVSTWRDEQVLAYRLQADDWVLDGRLTPQGPSSTGVGFGAAIALQGNVAVVGSPQGTVGQVTRAGWVDVFRREEIGWVHQMRLADRVPGASAALGGILALDGDFLFAGIQNHDLPSVTDAGKVVVFQNMGGNWAWSRDLLPPSAAKNGQFGYSMKVSDARLFVASITPAKVFEFSISNGLTLVSQTTASGIDAVSGDLLVTRAQYPRAAEIFRRQSDQSWRLEKTVDGNSYVFGSALVKDGGVYVGTYTGGVVRAGEVKLFQKLPDGTWTTEVALQVISSDRLRDVKFGRRLAVSDAWMVVGAPVRYSTDGAGGLVFIYRKEKHGQWVFHSLLSPRTVTPKMHPGFFGARVAISGDFIAVGTSDVDTDWPGSQIIMYRYQASADTWNEESVIEAPKSTSPQKFGLELALEGDVLAAVFSPAASGGVGVYRRAASGWDLEDVLLGPSGSLSMDGGRLLVTSSSGYEAYVCGKAKEGWTITKRLLTGVPNRYDGIGSQGVISGNRIMFGGGNKASTFAVPFELIGDLWQRRKPLVAPDGWDFKSTSCSLSGSAAVFANIDQTALYVLSQGKWNEAKALMPWRSRVESVALRGGQVFTGSGTGNVWVQDLVKAPAFLVSSDYPEIAGENGIPTFDAGEHVVGTNDPEFAVISAGPLGTMPVKVDVSISGDTAEFTLLQTQFEIGINQEIQTRLSFKPLTVGTREVRVTFKPDMPGALPQTFAFRVRIVAQKAPLQFTQQPASGFVYPASFMFDLECQLTGTRPWTFRWYTDGRLLPYATGRSCALDPKSAGRYHVEVTNAAGTIRSEDSLIGYFEVKTPEVVVQPGGTARMEVTATGPGVQIQWEIYQNEEWVPLTDKEDISGSRTPVLTVRNARQSTTYRAYLTWPTPLGPEPVEAACNLHVVQPPVVQFEGQQLTRGEPFAKGIEVLFDGPYLSGPVVRVSGLPPGLTATPEGYIEGTPTRTGSYRVTITVTISGVTGSRVVGLSVTEAGLPPPGIYWGWFDEIDGQPQRYAVVADLQPSGALSAVVYLGAARHPLAGLLKEGTGWQSRRSLLPYQLEGKPQEFWLSASPGRKSLYLNALAPDIDEVEPLLLSELRLIKPSAVSEVPASLGNHNLGLIFDPVRVGGPEGHGYGILTVSSDHRVTYVSQMPDGSSLTGSSWLSSPSLEESGTSRFYLYQADAASRNRLYGAAIFTSDVEDPDSITPEYLEWQKLPGKGRVFAEGFDPVPLTFLSSRPHTVSSRLMQPGGEHSLTISGPEIYLEKIPFNVSPQRQPLFDTGLGNPAQARFKFFAPLNFLVGQFTLRDPDPLNLQRTLTRQVQFYGMLLPEHGIGVGSFRLPSLPDKLAMPPTTLQTSPIHPGAVKIELSSPLDL